MRKLMQTILVALLLTALAAPAWAAGGTPGAGHQANLIRDLRKLHPLALRGDAAAQYKVARIYKEYAPTDGNRAVYWMTKAASQGHVQAQFELAQMYLGSEAIKPDLNQAVHWFQQAANQGYVKAMLDLAALYGDQLTIWFPTKMYNPHKSAYWYSRAAQTLRQAAEQGDADAQLRLGCLYHRGWGMPADPQKAQYWFGRATRKLRQTVAQGDARAASELAKFYLKLAKRFDHVWASVEVLDAYPVEGVEWYIKPADDWAEASKWYSKAAELGQAESMVELACKYHYGMKVPKDPAKAALWGKKAAQAWRKAAEGGDAKAMISLGKLYLAGIGVDQDSKQGLLWLTKAAEQGDTQAMKTLAESYRDGRGVAKDGDKAKFWALKAVATMKKKAEQGDAASQYSLADCYAFEEHGMPHDQARAIYWYQKAAAQGHAFSMFVLGNAQLVGEDLGLSQQQAIEYLQKAGEQDEHLALTWLARMYLEGKRVPRDYNKARYWNLKLARSGDWHSMFTLGKLAEQGLGGPADKVKAYMWYQLASLASQEAGQARDRVAQKMTPAQIAEAKRLIQEWNQRL